MGRIRSIDVFLDFETRSRAKLVGKDSVGAWRYSEDPSTEALCLSYAFGEEEPDIWTAGQPIPKRLEKHILEGLPIHGWNAMSFERAIFENVMGPKHGWPTPQRLTYYDTMLDALALALPAALDKCGAALGMADDTKKDKRGKNLIQRLCKPITAGKKKGEFRERSEFTEEYAELYVYCKQDVVAERAIFKKLPKHIEMDERQIALIIMKMNERGIPIDLPAVKAIYRAVELEKEKLKDLFEMITNVSSPTQTAKFKEWMNYKLPKEMRVENVQAETLRDLLKIKQLPQVVRNVIGLTQGIKLTSTAKYAKILKMVCKDGTVKNNFIHHKANTGRLAGSGFQAQNLPGGCEPDPDPIIDAFVDGDFEFIRLWGGVLRTASRLLRAIVKAPSGFKFVNGDLKGIEARGAMWVAEEWELLELVKKGLDNYKITAAEMYSILVSEVDKVQRAAGKIGVLSGQFGGGWRALLNMALKMNMEMDKDTAKKYNRDFRKGRPKLVKKWEHFDIAAKKAIINPGVVVPVDKTRRYGFVRSGNFLFMVLPNRRMLSFPYPELRNEMFFGRQVTNVTAMWVDERSQWTRRHLTGANLFQSAVQATCRDLIMEAHVRTERAGMPLMLSVHDEQQSLVPDDARYDFMQYEEIMCQVPDWASGFPIEADCWEGYRFKK